MIHAIKIAFIITAGLYLSACSFKYSWSESEIEEGAITSLVVKGDSAAVNGQNDDTDRVIYSMGGSTYTANYKEVSEGLRQHLNIEINKFDQKAHRKKKTLKVLVTDIQHSSDLTVRAFIEVTVILGNGKKIYLSARESGSIFNASAGNGITDAINNAIAATTIKILNHTTVRKYLTK